MVHFTAIRRQSRRRHRPRSGHLLHPPHLRMGLDHRGRADLPLLRLHPHGPYRGIPPLRRTRGGHFRPGTIRILLPLLPADLPQCLDGRRGGGAPTTGRYPSMSGWTARWRWKSSSPLSMEDISAAFDYYMDNYNEGRPFVLAGFSQGGKAVVELVKHAPAEVLERMVAAYAPHL